MSASESRSEKECAASQIIAELRPYQPARAMPTASTKLTTAPASVIWAPSA